jgi:SAM-dependent methyltransferase
MMNRNTKKMHSSKHYLGEQGKAYFAYQSQGTLQRGRINARKFSRFVRSTDTVLDFGCGNGALLAHLECRRRIGVEVNPAARDVAQAAGLETHETLDTIPDRSVDLVISNHALEHVPCPLEALVGLFDKTMTGGRAVLCVPIDDWRTQKAFEPDDINHHLYTWTPHLLGNLLLEAGYEIEQTWVYNHAWPPSNWQQLDDLLPVWLFDLSCAFTAWRYKRRQIMALARKP